MRPEYFYYQTTKNIIAAFGLLFRDVVYVNDWDQQIKVPIHYSPKEKFVTIIQAFDDHDLTKEYSWGLPRFGFELIDIAYDSTRMLNPMSRIQNNSGGEQKYMFNRVPYTFSFALYLAVRKFEDGLKIMEQVIPFFTPDLNITIKDKADFGIATDIPVLLNSVGYTIDYQGDFQTVRTITWQCNFMAKGYLYSNVREQQRIKETIVKMEDKDFNAVYESFTSEVFPRDADREDSHIIEDNIHDGKPPEKFLFEFTSGQMSSVEDTDSDEPATVLNIMSMHTGELGRIVESLK
jgi:hypothetical protein